MLLLDALGSFLSAKQCKTGFCNPVLRPGNVVLFHVPNAENRIEIGFVLSVWKGVKAPKLHTDPCPIDSVSAFRALTLDPLDASQDWVVDWVACNKSSAYAVRLESLIAVLDVEQCASAQ